MKEFKYVIKDEQGIHARPAGMFVKEAAAFSSKVTISKDGKEVDAKRILGVMVESQSEKSPFLKRAMTR